MQRISGQNNESDQFPPLSVREVAQNTQRHARRLVQDERSGLQNKRVVVLIVSRSSQQSHIASKIVASEFAAQYDLEWVQSGACMNYDHSPSTERLRLHTFTDSENTSEDEESCSTSDDEYGTSWLFCNSSANSDRNVNTNKKISTPNYVYSVSLRRVVELNLQQITGYNARFIKIWSKNDTDNPPGHTMPLKQTLRNLLATRSTIPNVWAKHVLDKMPMQGVFILDGFNTKEEICTFKDAGAKIVLVESGVEEHAEDSSACKYSLCDVLVDQDVDMSLSLKRLVSEGTLL